MLRVVWPGERGVTSLLLAQSGGRRYSRDMKTFVREITTGTKAMMTTEMTTIITGITICWPAGPGVR